MDWKTLFYSFPWVQNSLMLERENFDKEKVTIALRAKFKMIPCTKSGCNHSSDGVKLVDKDAKCICHIATKDERDFAKISDLWNEMDTKLQIIHEGLLKLQCVESLVTGPEVSEIIQDHLKDEIKSSYANVVEKARIFQYTVLALDDRPQFTEFEFVDKDFNDLLELFEKAHQSMGSALSQYIGHRMMKMVIEDTPLSEKDKDSELKYEGSVLPSEVFKKIFNFSSLFAELKHKIEKYEKGKPKISVSTSVRIFGINLLQIYDSQNFRKFYLKFEFILRLDYLGISILF